MKTVIHINKHIIAANGKHGRLDAPLTVKDYRQNRKGHRALLCDPVTGEVLAEVLHEPLRPLPCGAKVWIKTDLEVRVIEDLEAAMARGR